jgi:hypothetical protein
MLNVSPEEQPLAFPIVMILMAKGLKGLEKDLPRYYILS